MSGWIIEHRAQGAYLGMVPAKSGAKTVPLFRLSDPRRPPVMFASLAAADATLRLFAPDAVAQAPYDIIPLR